MLNNDKAYNYMSMAFSNNIFAFRKCSNNSGFYFLFNDVLSIRHLDYPNFVECVLSHFSKNLQEN